MYTEFGFDTEREFVRWVYTRMCVEGLNPSQMNNLPAYQQALLIVDNVSANQAGNFVAAVASGRLTCAAASVLFSSIQQPTQQASQQPSQQPSAQTEATGPALVQSSSMSSINDLSMGSFTGFVQTNDSGENAESNIEASGSGVLWLVAALTLLAGF